MKEKKQKSSEVFLPSIQIDCRDSQGVAILIFKNIDYEKFEDILINFY